MKIWILIILRQKKLNVILILGLYLFPFSFIQRNKTPYKTLSPWMENGTMNYHTPPTPPLFWTYPYSVWKKQQLTETPQTESGVNVYVSLH